MTDTLALVLVGRGLWLADGAVCEVAGFRYPTRMAVVRLADGGLWLWSPVAMSRALRTAVDALGPVRHIVAPNHLHHLALAEWQEAYPAARTYAPSGLRKKRADLRFDADLAEGVTFDWAEEVGFVVVEGNLITTEVVFFHQESGTVLFTDLIQQFPDGWFRGWRAVVARLDLMTGREARVPRKFRLAFVNRGKARLAVQRILGWPIRNVVMAHGAPVFGRGDTAVRRAFAWLTG